MAGNSNSGGPRKGAGRKPKAEKLLIAGFSAPWFTPEFQKTKWQELVASDDDRIAIDAMKYLTDRIHGRAKQQMEVSGPEGGPIPTRLEIEFVSTSANANH